MAEVGFDFNPEVVGLNPTSVKFSLLISFIFSALLESYNSILVLLNIKIIEQERHC